VAMSLYCMQQLAGSRVADIWWLDHRAPTNVLQIADLLDSDTELSHPFYRALWYWYEVEMRFAAWRTRLPSVKVARFETDWFDDRAKVFELFDTLGLEYERSTFEAMTLEREHTKAALKVLPALPLSEAQEMDRRFRQRLRSRGLDLSAVQYRPDSAPL